VGGGGASEGVARIGPPVASGGPMRRLPERAYFFFTPPLAAVFAGAFFAAVFAAGFAAAFLVVANVVSLL